MTTGRIKTGDKGPKKVPLIGKIKIGEKVEREGGVSIPRSLDYFKATGDYAGLFHEAFGDKPTSIPIIFMTDDVTQSCNERFELRDKKTGHLLGSGDGESFKLWNFHEDRNQRRYEDFIVDSDEKKQQLSDYSKKHSNGELWRAILTCEFIIPKISRVMGVWRLESKGVMSTIKNIRDTYDTVQEFAGTVVNIPFDLQVKKVTSQHPGEKKLYPVVSLIPNINTDRMDDVHAYLQQGNNLRDIKKMLEVGMPDAKKLESMPEVKQLESGTTVQAQLFDGK